MRFARPERLKCHDVYGRTAALEPRRFGGWGIWGYLTLREQPSRQTAPAQPLKPVTASAAAANVRSPLAA
jgi:hypothetical protein